MYGELSGKEEETKHNIINQTKKSGGHLQKLLCYSSKTKA